MTDETKACANPYVVARQVEKRVLCRLAWNGWDDTPEARKIIAEHEAKDGHSAAAWDRVIIALSKAMEEGRRIS